MNASDVLTNLKTSSAKQENLYEVLRDQIVTGALPPGTQFPTRSAIKRVCGFANDTIQRAFERLINDGFVSARRGRGSFVTERPPHLHRYGVTFFSNPADTARWRRFDTALSQEVNAITHSSGDWFELYHNINSRSDSTEVTRLCNDIQEYRLAGVIFSVQPANAEELLGHSTPRTPSVALTPCASSSGYPSRVYVDYASFFMRALQYLADRGRQRIAILTITGDFWPQHKPIAERLIADFGMTTQPYWSLEVSPAGANGACGCMHLLMQPNQTERPDGLIITDDNLTGHALAGLMAAGARISQDIDVVTHWNFPLQGAAGLPVCRLGFDNRAILQKCMELLQQQRQGVTPDPKVHLVPAVFEHEMPHLNQS